MIRGTTDDGNHPFSRDGLGKVLNQEVSLPILSEKQITLTIKREDLIHPLISGNKFRKLAYNLIEAQKLGFDTILTFGGAYSNHIAATAYAGKLNGFKTIGIIRGEELSGKWDANPTLQLASEYGENFQRKQGGEANPTLQLASEYGMRFKFISRADYREKQDPSYLKKLRQEFGSFYTLPEGGTNAPTDMTLKRTGNSKPIVRHDV